MIFISLYKSRKYFYILFHLNIGKLNLVVAIMKNQSLITNPFVKRFMHKKSPPYKVVNLEAAKFEFEILSNGIYFWYKFIEWKGDLDQFLNLKFLLF